MRITAVLVLCICLAASSLLTIPATANTIVVKQVDQGTASSGATFQILLDEAPTGLAGYRMEIAAGGSPGSQIVQVQFPDWAALHQADALPAGNTTLKAVDLREGIGTGARNILLATVNLTSGPDATQTLAIRSAQIEDDSGNVSMPLVPGRSAPANATPVITTPISARDLPSVTAGMTTSGTNPPALTSSPTGVPANVTTPVMASPVVSVTTMNPDSTTNEQTLAPIPAGKGTAVPPTASAGTPPATKTPVPVILVLVAAGMAIAIRRT